MNTGESLSAYLARIGYAGRREPTLAVLRDIHVLHPAAIAFEGLDPFLGRPVDLDPSSIQAKLVHGRRGGSAMSTMRCSTTCWPPWLCGSSARRPGSLDGTWTRCPAEPPDHPGRSCRGTLHRRCWRRRTDPTAPLRLEPGLEQVTSHGTYRLVRDGEVFETQLRLSDRWAPMYRFNLEPQTRADFEMANWFASTHPRTRFTRNLVAARVVGQTRVISNTSLTIRHSDGDLEQRTLANTHDLQDVLESIMGLDLPVAGTAIWARLPSQPVPLWP